MNIDEIMEMIDLLETGYAHNHPEMKLAIEKYAKAERESMRQACIKACEGSRCSTYGDYSATYNEAISDVVVEMTKIKL